MYKIYNLLWAISFIILLPWLLINRKSSLGRKFALTDMPETPAEKAVWIHSLSVGEVISAQPVIESLKEKYPGKKIILTVKTGQGMEIARSRLAQKVDEIYFMPLDFRWSLSRLIASINPEIFILVETDIWPGLISLLKKKGIKIILINGRVSPGTLKGYMRLRFYFRKLLNDIDLLLMQSDLDRNRLIDVGVSPEKMKTAGNIKFDQDWSPMDKDEFSRWTDVLKMEKDRDIIVAGSTHEGEEAIILNAYKKLLERMPGLVLIIAPRKTDRAGNICEMSISMGLSTLKRSDLTGNNNMDYQVLILDTLGELGRIYGLGTVSFVGGSMVPIGGHNLLEPAVFGIPVLYGRYTHNFVLMSELLADAGGGVRVEDEDALFNTFEKILADRELLNKMGENAARFVKENSGAVTRIIDYLEEYIVPN